VEVAERDREIAELTRQIEELKAKLSEARRRREPEPVEDYALTSDDGAPIRLSELFGGTRDLIVVHNMGRGCVYCTMWADGFTGALPHLQNRAAFVVVSPDPPEVQRAFAESRGWNFSMVSAAGSSFVRDMGFELGEEGKPDYWPGISAFHRRDDGSIVRIGFDVFGPGDDYCPPWRMFDLLQGGAGDWEPRFSYD
jgi:predicted dithiol-disulfide oxidoreductase (DUF899 family)